MFHNFDHLQFIISFTLLCTHAHTITNTLTPSKCDNRIWSRTEKPFTASTNQINCSTTTATMIRFVFSFQPIDAASTHRSCPSTYSHTHTHTHNHSRHQTRQYLPNQGQAGTCVTPLKSTQRTLYRLTQKPPIARARTISKQIFSKKRANSEIDNTPTSYGKSRYYSD